MPIRLTYFALTQHSYIHTNPAAFIYPLPILQHSYIHTNPAAFIYPLPIPQHSYIMWFTVHAWTNFFESHICCHKTRLGMCKWWHCSEWHSCRHSGRCTLSRRVKGAWAALNSLSCLYSTHCHLWGSTVQRTPEDTDSTSCHSHSFHTYPRWSSSSPHTAGLYIEFVVWERDSKV